MGEPIVTIRPDDYRQAGRYAAQDKRYREAAKAVDAAGEAFDRASELYNNDQIAYAEFSAARELLREVDPTNYRLS